MMFKCHNENDKSSTQSKSEIRQCRNLLGLAVCDFWCDSWQHRKSTLSKQTFWNQNSYDWPVFPRFKTNFDKVLPNLTIFACCVLNVHHGGENVTVYRQVSTSAHKQTWLPLIQHQGLPHLPLFFAVIVWLSDLRITTASPSSTTASSRSLLSTLIFAVV